MSGVVRGSGEASRRVAIVGGGINGAGIAWELSRRGYAVTLFEKGRVGEQTSSKTTKMIHGGIRYLEHLHFGLVRESLRERAWMLEHMPDLVHPIEILLPVYADSPRNRLTLRAGLTLYDLLAGTKDVPRHHALSRDEMLQRLPLEPEGLRGGFSYWDAQVDDLALVRRAIESARVEGAVIREGTRVDGVRRNGDGWIVNAGGAEEHYDLLVNAAGPWMNELLAANRIRARYVLSLVRGSHIVVREPIVTVGALLQSTTDRRVFFVLPWKGKTLIGTTEERHKGSLDDVRATDDEIDYLIARFNRYMSVKIGRGDVIESFAGVRPLVGRATNPSAIGRDSRVVRHGNVINVFGGKMTTFLSLARSVAMRADNYFAEKRD
jgi:glycerol-3-phosphate dehydrogenase